MKLQNQYRKLLSLGVLFFLSFQLYSQDPNFHIYLCFGQSNMEGQGSVEAQDQTVDSRFQLLQGVDCPNLNRTESFWYEAIPPLCRCWSGLSPADYFGRTMVEYLPDSISVGIINVSVAGCKIELFDKDNYQDYVATITADWLLNIIAEYGGNPYAHLVDMASQAQQDGVIKGILLHQGESNTGDQTWPAKVKVVYDNLINDLGLDPAEVPLLAGEVVHEDQDGTCASMNSIISQLPGTVNNSYVISSSGCTAASDKTHFDSEGYRVLGRRYGLKMLEILGIDTSDKPGTVSFFMEAECTEVGQNWQVRGDSSASNKAFVTITEGMESSLYAPEDSVDIVHIPFSVDTASVFTIHARVNCPGIKDDSFWVKLDDDRYRMLDGLITDGWEWRKFAEAELEVGEHQLAIAYRDDGPMLDKIHITNFLDSVGGIGEEALNICVPDTVTIDTLDGIQDNEFSAFSLSQNYPNPFSETTTISIELQQSTHVCLKVYNLLGEEVASLVNMELSAGKYQFEFNREELSAGTYFYTLSTDRGVLSRKMIVFDIRNL